MTWEDLLEEVEARLNRVEEGLVNGNLEVPRFSPPGGLGQLPSTLRPRAERALARTLEMEVELEALQRRIAGALRRSRSAAQSPAVYLDKHL